LCLGKSFKRTHTPTKRLAATANGSLAALALCHSSVILAKLALSQSAVSKHISVSSSAL